MACPELLFLSGSMNLLFAVVPAYACQIRCLCNVLRLWTPMHLYLCCTNA